MEQHYSAFGRELLVVYLAVKYFHYFLKGCPFIIFTDDKPLTNAFTLSKATYSVRETRHLAFLAEFSTDFRHMKGADNTLSHVSSLAMTQFMLQRLVELQEHNQELCILRSSPSSSLHFHDVYFPNHSISIICNIDEVTGRHHPYAPLLLRRLALARFTVCNIPGFAHPSTSWQNVSYGPTWTPICPTGHMCLTCRQCKAYRHCTMSLARFALPDSRFGVNHIDLFGLFPPSKVSQYITTIINRFMRWPEAAPVSNVTVETVATSLVSTWVAHFGTPAEIVTNRGRQFKVALFQQLTRLFCTSHFRATAYHPQANDLVQWFHHQLKVALLWLIAAATNESHLFKLYFWSCAPPLNKTLVVCLPTSSMAPPYDCQQS